MRNRCRRQPAITTCTSGIQPREEGCEGDSPVLSRCWPRFTRALEPAPLSLRIASCVITRFHVTIKKRSRNPPLPTLAARPTFPSPLLLSRFPPFFSAQIFRTPPRGLFRRFRSVIVHGSIERGGRARKERRRGGEDTVISTLNSTVVEFVLPLLIPRGDFSTLHVKASKWNFACRFIGRSMVSILSTVKKKKKKVKGGSTRVIE